MASTAVGLPPNGSILEGKWALITGASQGVGWKIAEAFASEKANLILVARSKANLDKVIRLEKRGRERKRKKRVFFHVQFGDGTLTQLDRLYCIIAV